jgi:hypothetical protein
VNLLKILFPSVENSFLCYALPLSQQVENLALVADADGQKFRLFSGDNAVAQASF